MVVVGEHREHSNTLVLNLKVLEKRPKVASKL